VAQRIGTTWFGSPDGASCIANTRDEATLRGELWRVPVDGTAPELLVAEDRELALAPTGPSDRHSGDVSADGQTVAYIVEDETHPPELWVADARLAQHRQATRLNPHLDDVGLGRARLVTWLTTEGDEARGALLLPPDWQEGQRVPLIVSIYPGRRSAHLHRWKSGAGIIHHQLLASHGYAVLQADIPVATPDATGRRTRWLSRAGLAGAVLPGVNEVIRLGIADPVRLGVMGHSGGGMAVNLLITETARFKAAISAAGAANAVSNFGQLRIRPDGLPDFYGVHV
jgi:dipeptidyl aminopeptidase/acylaminoacyl peptidase